MSVFTAPSARPAPVLLVIAGLCALFELAFTLTDAGALGLPRLRNAGILHGAFWPGLLGDWTPLFPGQRLTMLVSYAFVHGGLLHMAFNMLILLHLGREAVARLGTPGFLLLFAVSSAGGGLAYWLLGDGETPMLGASGVVFGLFGATMWWDIQRRRAAGASLEPVLRLAGGLVLMNGLLSLLVSGMLAWQAHLGGFVGGMALAAIVTPAPGRRPGL